MAKMNQLLSGDEAAKDEVMRLVYWNYYKKIMNGIERLSPISGPNGGLQWYDRLSKKVLALFKAVRMHPE
ncbi:hypothetical protein CTAM01_16850 [Colletotrichum tamarilloi]|uniref:Uncharacterized protein n=1 Tax=Colletotrichum tamarilloi TaxID=1209934 RepID=A0ABQ9QHC1_9PEZI|nr:uncharacterized protein CTAM01_16850 [Colletotrichum tamarilloi]KAK1470281.1 hypothetical protein CTAM01_16850 [Colletotrichum tamarilloi]